MATELQICRKALENTLARIADVSGVNETAAVEMALAALAAGLTRRTAMDTYYNNLETVYTVAKKNGKFYTYANGRCASGPYKNSQDAWTSAQRLATTTTGFAERGEIPDDWKHLPTDAEVVSGMGWLVYGHA